MTWTLARLMKHLSCMDPDVTACCASDMCMHWEPKDPSSPGKQAPINVLRGLHEVQITIVSMNGETLTEVSVPTGQTIGELKSEVAREQGCSAASLKLLQDSLELSNHHLLVAATRLHAIFLTPTADSFRQAAESGDEGLVRSLLRSCADGAARRALLLETWALHRAAAAGQAGVAGVLVDAAAAEAVLDGLLTLQDEDGCTALHRAINGGHGELVPLLLNAASRSDTPRLQLLLQADFESHTALRRAASLGHAAAARALLDCASGDEELQALLQADSAQTPLEAAARKGHLDTVQVLLAAAGSGCFPGPHALHMAADGGHSAVAELLLACASSSRELLLALDRHGDSALHYAARAGRAGVADVLVQAAASEGVLRELLALSGRGGETALELAVPRGGAVLEVLLSAEIRAKSRARPPR